MMRSFRLLVASAVIFSSTLLTSQAASLRVAPIIVDLRAPTAASTIRVWNDAQKPINIQVRIFRWTQKNGEDVYEPTNAVTVSPPITTLKPGGENLVRVVRTTKQPVEGEESYRLIVDELPNPSRRQGGTVTLVVRHSIPVFFASSELEGAAPSWTVQRRKGGYSVTVSNRGGQRLKVSNLSLGRGGKRVAQRKGLVGYVLGNSSASWFVSGQRLSGGTITISADSEAGPFDATARLQGG